MGFYWKDGKDQLLARSGDLPPSSTSPEPSSTGNPWTTFTMDLREPAVLEGPLDLARFFVTSLTFMRSMKKIDMLVDDVRVFRASKVVKDKTRITKRGLKTTSTNGMMSVTGVDATGMLITADVMQWLSGAQILPTIASTMTDRQTLVSCHLPCPPQQLSSTKARKHWHHSSPPPSSAGRLHHLHPHHQSRRYPNLRTTIERWPP